MFVVILYTLETIKANFVLVLEWQHAADSCTQAENTTKKQSQYNFS